VVEMDRSRVSDITPKTGFQNLFFSEGKFFGLLRFSCDWRIMTTKLGPKCLEKKLMYDFKSSLSSPKLAFNAPSAQKGFPCND